MCALESTVLFDSAQESTECPKRTLFWIGAPESTVIILVALPRSAQLVILDARIDHPVEAKCCCLGFGTHERVL